MTDPNKPIVDHRMIFFNDENATPPNNTGNTPPPVVEPGSSSSTTTTKTTTAPVSTEVPAEYKASSYAELIPQLEKRMAEYKPLSEEERKKLRRRQKAEGIISGISDAVQSVANLIFTHNYAPNMYNAQAGMSTKARGRFDKAKAEREAENDKFFNYALTLGKLKDDAAKDERNWSHTLEREKVADVRAEAKEKRDQEIHDLNKKLRNHQIDEAGYKAKVTEVEAKYAAQLEESKIGRNKAAAGASYAAASASKARARYYGKGGNSGGKNEDLQKAYDFWESLTPAQKKQFRDRNNRGKTVKMGPERKPVYKTQYMDDDDDFILNVYRQHEGWKNNQNGRGKKKSPTAETGNGGKKKSPTA